MTQNSPLSSIIKEAVFALETGVLTLETGSSLVEKRTGLLLALTVVWVMAAGRANAKQLARALDGHRAAQQRGVGAGFGGKGQGLDSSQCHVAHALQLLAQSPKAALPFLIHKNYKQYVWVSEG